MNPSLLISLVLVPLPIAYLAWSFLSVDRKAQRAVRDLLTQGAAIAEAGPQSRGSALELIGYRLTPGGYVQKLDRLLSLAGRPPSLPLGRVLAAKPLLGLFGALFGFLISANSSSGILKLVGIFVVLLGYFIPDLMLYSKGQERQKAMQLELANTMDQMLISVEAGLGFEGAMARAGENGKGPLAEELVRTLQDMQVGRSRRESYLALAERTNVPELRSFVQAVIQADTYGIAISRVLRVQAKVMRVKRRQRAEEKAMKLPVMVLFPLLLFIFPVLFIAILGPAVINAIATFSGG
ncbi:secretion system protein [Arthrobacter sp. SRS-W-1-2016]|uniref:type II secretion system F family protein n=1 Tax=unclassified Arthrobacter TaxID=235627 RepID=UPI000990FFC0|nr:MULTISPECIES: type II secretion system F family protein [unclassified Arthrobacter]OOP61128.1 secretion system protein [Arthrobacter sp. SRS-W-1-2016]UYY80894.1 type II secretion system F family protein [Arthrobacter sp. YA7-1]